MNVGESLSESLITYIDLAGRIRFPPDEIARELHSLAKLGADWPKATVRQWQSEIENALSDGRLSLNTNGEVCLPVVSQPVVQLLLF